MAYFRKRGRSWYVEIRKGDISKHATFDTKAEAQSWATQVEAEIIADKRCTIPNKSFGDLLQKYAEEISVTKKGHRWEEIRINQFLRDDISLVRLPDLDETHFAAWRDRRLQKISNASVRREWNLLSSACNIAIREWKWLEKNPMENVRRPPPVPPRDRLVHDEERQAILYTLGYDPDLTPTTASARVGAAFMFALETAMRIGEICALRKDDIFLNKQYVCVSGKTHGAGKTQAARRNVPLSPEAIRILKQLPHDDPVFGLSSSIADALFRKAKNKALVEGLHFHDTRHTAITQLAKKLSVFELARMVGHKDLRMLMIYYNEDASEIARKL